MRLNNPFRPYNGSWALIAILLVIVISKFCDIAEWFECPLVFVTRRRLW